MTRKLILICIRAASCLAILVGNAQADLNLADGTPTGQWWNPARDGEGFYVEVIGEGDNLQIAVAMYSYDEQGNQLWLVGNVEIADGDIGATVPVFLIEGPVWGTGYDPADKDTEQFGNIVVRFPTCDSAIFSVNSNVQGLESGSYSLVRLTEIVGMDCVDSPPAPEGVVTPGLWTGEDVCFFVNTEPKDGWDPGERLDESDLCNGRTVEAEFTGSKSDINGEIGSDACQANIVCDGGWIIDYSVSPVSVICSNLAGGVSKIYFYSATDAVVTGFEALDLEGTICAGKGDATPAQ